MFSKLQFLEVGRSEVFREVTLEVDALDQKWREFIVGETREQSIEEYIHKD